MPRLRLAFLIVLSATSASCATISPPAASVENEAREFMAGYARDLRAGDRPAIAARYDRRGAYMAGSGEKQVASPDSIRARYQHSSWTAPARFEWRDLSYEAVGPQAVLVSGRFEWTTTAGQSLPGSYTALLVREQGQLRIRAEHEDIAPSALRARLCAR